MDWDSEDADAEETEETEGETGFRATLDVLGAVAEERSSTAAVADDAADMDAADGEAALEAGGVSSAHSGTETCSGVGEAALRFERLVGLDDGLLDTRRLRRALEAAVFFGVRVVGILAVSRPSLFAVGGSIGRMYG